MKAMKNVIFIIGLYKYYIPVSLYISPAGSFVVFTNSTKRVAVNIAISTTRKMAFKWPLSIRHRHLLSLSCISPSLLLQPSGL